MGHLMTEEKIDCRWTCPSDARKILLKYGKNRFWKQWAEKKILLSWTATFGLSQLTPSLRKSAQWYGPKGTQRKQSRNADACKVTQLCTKPKKCDCQLCHEKSTELRRLYHCQGLWKVRNEMEDEMRVYEQITIGATSET